MKWPELYSRTSSGDINYWRVWTSGPEVCVCWGRVGTANPQQDVYVAEAKNVGRSNETTPEQQAQKEAQASFDKHLRLKYYYSIEEAKHALNIKPMRAHTLDDKRAKKIKWPIYVQPKYNGVRCMAYNLPDGTVRLMSRGGKDYTLPHVQEELKGRIAEGMCLDGELYVHGMNLQTIRHHIETYSDESLQVQLHCYDITSLPPSELSWEGRLIRLSAWFQQHSVSSIVLATTESAQSMKDVDRYHDKWVQEGYEGLIARLPEGVYKLASRSTSLLKYKKFFEEEFSVTGWSVGKDDVIVFRCLQEDGKQFDVRPMGTEQERAQMLKDAQKYINRMLTVRYQERSSDNIPMYPVGTGFRPAKDMD